MAGATAAVIGAGRMGSAAARRLAAAGFSLVLWNRTRERAERLAREIGASLAESPFDAVQRAQFAVIALADEDALFSVLGGFHRMDGAVIVNTTTITPQGSVKARSFIEGLGGCYVEAPIVGGPRVFENGEAIGIVAGSQTCVGLAKSVLDALFKEVIYVGDDTAAAAALKLSYNALLISTVEALAESVALAEAYGVDAGTLARLLANTVFRGVAEKYLDRMRRPPSKEASFTLRLAEKDLEYASRASYHAGVPAPGIEGSRIAYSFARLAGLSDADYTRVYHALKGAARRA